MGDRVGAAPMVGISSGAHTSDATAVQGSRRKTPKDPDCRKILHSVTGHFITGLRDDEEERPTPQRTPDLVFVLVGRSCGLMGHRRALGGREAQRVDLINNRTYP